MSPRGGGFDAGSGRGPGDDPEDEGIDAGDADALLEAFRRELGDPDTLGLLDPDTGLEADVRDTFAHAPGQIDDTLEEFEREAAASEDFYPSTGSGSDPWEDSWGDPSTGSGSDPWEDSWGDPSTGSGSDRDPSTGSGNDRDPSTGSGSDRDPSTGSGSEPLSEREEAERTRHSRTDWREQADRVFDELMERVGEAQPEPRLGATRRAVELLGDVHRTAPIVHVTGTNGKTSTARIIASLLGAHGLRVGLLTSPHLERLNERIEIEGRPISDERLAVNWDDIRPFIELVDTELEGKGEPRLTFFEALTVLAFACFTDAPVDAVVLEVGMGGEWDSTNVADGDVAVFTPIALDHTHRLGSTLAEIARTKAGIIKPAARVVSAAQDPEALAELASACALRDATLAVEGSEFELVSDVPEGPAARTIVVRGRAGTYEGVLPLRGEHQAHNAAVAIAAVEAFFGGEQRLRDDTVEQGLVAATSPGRLQRIGQEPPMYVDAAHNPHGAAALAAAVPEAIGERVVVVLGALDDKDVAGVIRELAPIADAFVATQSDSPRAIDAFDLADRIAEVTGRHAEAFERADDALEYARDLVSGEERGAVLVTGSTTLLGDAMRIARDEGWGNIRA